MIKNYIKTAIRSLKKNKGFTAINVLGLSIGLATCLLIVFYVVDELSYDTYNLKADRIYRINDDIKFGGIASSYAVAMAPLAQTLKKDFPEVEQTVRFRENGSFTTRKGNERIREHRVVYADSTLFSIFTLPMLQGNPNTALVEPHSIVLNETVAKKYFNSTNIVGRVITFNDTVNYKITGVIRDIPEQSHFKYDFFISMSSYPDSRNPTWLSNNYNTYILLRPGADVKRLEAKFPQMIIRYVGPQLQSFFHFGYDAFEKSGNYLRINLTPLMEIHLKSNRVAELRNNGNIQYVYIFSAIAIFILLIACVNFMNLSTARSSNRAREVGVRKVLGSPRKYLIYQFLTESVVVTFAATIIALMLAYFFLPLFNQLADKQLAFTAKSLTWLLPSLAVIVVVIGLLAGSYPAFFLSGFKPINVLKGKLVTGFKGAGLRSFLVVFQFFISILLIISTLVIYNQLHYIQTKNLGFDRDQVVRIQNISSLDSHAATFKKEIKQLPGVINATMTGYLPADGDRSSNSMFQDPTLDQKRALLTQYWQVDEDYIKTLDMKIIKGRNFSAQMGTDSTAIIINESAAKIMGVRDPVNKILYRPLDDMAKKVKPYHIIGVVKDFNFNTLRENITPLTLVLGQDRGALSVKVNTRNLPALLAQMESKWKDLSPNQHFAYSFLDEDFDAIYRTEQRTGTISILFTSLAILIACLGLFGLAAYSAEQRTKEIGIRKVLGAGVSTLVGMLSRDFIKLVLIAIVLASPIAWFLMQLWLRDFAYRVNIQWWVIALAGFAAVFIAFVTISFQSVRAALANPVKSLRSE